MSHLSVLAPDDGPLRVETCSAFFILIYIFKCWCVRRSNCLLPFDLPPQDAFLQEIKTYASDLAVTGTGSGREG
jgi:hypothetical protein